MLSWSLWKLIRTIVSLYRFFHVKKYAEGVGKSATVQFKKDENSSIGRSAEQIM